MTGQPRLFQSVGPMEAIFRDKDWTTCSLGPPTAWSARLQGYVDMMLRVPTGAIIFWGPDQVQLYNFAYSDIMGPRHPKYLGAPYRECWPDTYDQIYPMMRRVLDSGEVVEVTNALVPVTRYGFNEETYFTFSFVPLRGDDGRIEGFIQYINETTRLVLAERRASTLRALAPRFDGAGNALQDATLAFQSNPDDLPFAVMWLPQPNETLETTTTFGIAEIPQTLAALAQEVMTSGEAKLIENVRSTVAEGVWPATAQSAMVLPLRRLAAEKPRGVVALGISARLLLDDAYRTFLESAAREIASNMAFEEENREKARLNDELRLRAEALQELDRAKTAFFSNVSHEFRTPITLMLGPIEDALGDHEQALPARQRERLELVGRSGTRLLKLVNSLLDFSRIEAGRTQAHFRAADLAEITRGLAGTFRSLIEHAGLALTVDCPPLPEPIWIDADMWEKIVLNLLSNAFKFTLEGGITVKLASSGDFATLTVTDTGTGVPSGELPKLFDRFHRVEGAKGRSFEGSGIGLALVQELVRLHGGQIRVSSQEGRGTSFEVSLPTGTAHVPEPQRAAASPARVKPSTGASSFVREAASWSVSDASSSPSSQANVEEPSAPREAGVKAGILLADDNADMRDYVSRLLEGQYRVRGVSNGIDALAAIQEEVPDLILSDVMMPGLDGFGLLRAVKGDPRTKLVPLILLSARAGEEARVEGIDAGADDYLVKPFAARELLTRVAARLEIARIQAGVSAELERLVDERTLQLRESNRELESFSYSVSHDLRAPLRHIAGFAEMLRRTTEGTLEPKAEGYLRTIAESAVRGGKLVDDLLAFSRVGRGEVRRLPVDLGRIVADARKALAPDEIGRKVRWTVPPLPFVAGDPDLLRLVIENVLSNALKYTQTRDTAEIEISASETPTDVTVSIKDNGVGFDMRYVAKLFGVFQRLHSNEEFDGTGIGLALARRIIARHGGTISAEGEIDRGATITFTLPRHHLRAN